MQENQKRTLEEIQGTIRAARDSVWVINDEIQKLADGQPANSECKGNIGRNVGHLKLVVADQEIIDSGEDISDLQEAIVVGEAKLAEDIWQTDN
jgi:hypothetical protein